MLRFACAFSLALLLPAAAAAARPYSVTHDGSVTVAFDRHHRVQERLTAAVALPGGGFVGAGATGRRHRLTLAGLNGDGSIDRAFGDGGAAVAPPGAVRADGIERATDGTLVVLSQQPSRDGMGAPVVVRADAAGRFDRGFGTDGVAAAPGVVLIGCTTVCHNVALRANGSVLVAGIAGRLPDDNRLGVAALRPDGAPDPGFGTGGLATPLAGAGLGESVYVQPGGRIVVVGLAGAASHPGGQSTTVLGLRADGSPDPAYGGGDGRADVGGRVFTTAQDAAGRLYLLIVPVGTDRTGSSRVIRLLPDGTRDAAWGAGGVADLGHEVVGTLFPEATGLTVTSSVDLSRLEQLRLDAAGRIVSRHVTAPRFGGGDFVRGRLVSLDRGLFDGFALARRADGALLLGGEARVTTGDGGADVTDGSQWAFALVRPDGSLAPTHPTARLRIGIRAHRERLGTISRRRGLRVTVLPRRRGLARVTATAHGHRIAADMVPLWTGQRTTTRIRLTAYGRRLVRHAHRVRVTIAIAATDLAGNRAHGRARVTLRR